MFPVLTRDQVEPLLDWITMSDALADGHRLPSAQIRDVLLAQGDNRLLSRAAWIDGLGAGVKSVTVFPGNAAAGMPSVQGAMLIFDAVTGAIEAVIDNALITRWKTAADSLLGARLLARRDSRHLLILGAGAVAESLIEAYPCAFPGLTISIWARRAEAAGALAARHPGVRVVTDLPEAVAGADIVATCTMTREPILKGDWLRPGQHIDLIGAYTPEMREADDTVLRRGRIFVDSRATTLGHIGELQIPLSQGVIRDDDVLGDLHQLVTDTSGRRQDDEITVFKNGGGAHLDLMTARLMLSRWRAARKEPEEPLR